ncbi:MAG: efflux RND transporter permease subunit, partial [Coleofasciculus sp.]|uniref:efflux RND transporter permease subunit n=1 Tax=Coleofasciculus sp. TaxID=3100458 RepID=UPI003A2529CD
MRQNKLFSQTRGKLALSYAFVMGVILSLLGFGVYEAIAHAHLITLERELKSVAGTLHDSLESKLKQPGQVEPRDSGQFMASLEMEPGTSFAKADESTYRFEQILLAQPDIDKVSSQTGFELTRNSTYFSGYSMGSVNSASLIVTLKDDRNRDIWEIMDSVEAEARLTIPGLRRIALKEMGVDVMATSAAPVQLAVYGEDLDILHSLAKDVLRIAEDTPGLVMPQTSSALTQPEYQIQVDRRRAEELGMNVRMVAEQARYALTGGFTRRYYNRPNLRQNSILVRYEEEERGTLNNLADTYITTPMGQQVPLKTVATLERHNGPTLIEHINGKRVVYVNGYYRKR